MFRGLFLFAKNLRRIAKALEGIEALYRMDCEARGIIVTNPTIRDQTEISYESKAEPIESVWD